ncbi:4-aminobutyrate--2-oxoglutarate transaminase [Cryptosporangium phraense]|uniref:(S)-3-amino-2-methylpropionate transaminase n=1 Tax=Cryptosporangium phraense TaxID=2593070 RepID=A0A545API0_9ACTN|nr:4-aminobutyrate--2-oxoglutarate transaminase [Cryptosporangium phraense]TQS43239.1 4-aminobutyrate--2-oxoglutarate transaminase [Cryptosporangium phraense]
MVPQERKLLTEIPGPRSQELLERRTSAVARGVSVMLPVFVTAAGGGILVDVDGNQLIDLGAGIAVTNVGNANPAVAAAVAAQAEAFTHTCFMVTPYEGYVAVCEALNRLTPGDFEKRSALFNSGAEAVENAVKIARAYTRRSAVVVFDHGYHGRTNLTMALTAKNMPYKNSFGPFAPEVYRLPTSYPYRDEAAGLDASGPAAAERALSILDKQVGAENVAALIIEPIQGEGGFVEPAPGFLGALAEYCRANGIVFVADEIQTGFGRTGTLFACEAEGIVPDLVTTAKGIAGGMPLAGVTGRAEIMDAAHVGGLGGTYGGNPVACAAALAAIDTIESDDLAGKARRIEEIVRPVLDGLAERYDWVGNVRGRGAMLAVEIVEPGMMTPAPQLTGAVNQACHQRGLVTLSCGTYGNVLRFLPPLVIGEDLLKEAFTLVTEAFDEVAANLPRAEKAPAPSPDTD